jgi:hypothetical protein
MAKDDEAGTPGLGAKNRIDPATVTRPVQLLAAWLVALIALEGTLLAGAHFISHALWLRAVLVIAAVVNIPLFIGLIFLLQTKFRAEIQEDTFYAEYRKRIDDAGSSVVVATMTNQLLSPEEPHMAAKGAVPDIERIIALLDESKPNVLTLRLGEEHYAVSALQMYLTRLNAISIVQRHSGAWG